MTALESIYMLPVKVFDGEPPEAPTIDFFKASPASMVGAGDVEFSWSVSGEWTYVNLSNADGIIADYLNPVGFEKIKRLAIRQEMDRLVIHRPTDRFSILREKKIYLSTISSTTLQRGGTDSY